MVDGAHHVCADSPGAVPTTDADVTVAGVRFAAGFDAAAQEAFDVCLAPREPLVGRARHLGPDAIAVSTVTLTELWFGAARSARPQRTRAEQDAALSPFRVLDFDAAAADRCATVRAHLATLGRPIGGRDLMIAAIALANRMTVVTSNTSELARVPELIVEDWTR